MHIAIFVPTLTGGGAERVMLRLATEFIRRGHSVDLVLKNHKGSYVQNVPDSVRVIELPSVSKLRARLSVLKSDPAGFLTLLLPVLIAPKPIMAIRCLPGLGDYLKRESPDVLLSALFYANLVAIWARLLSESSTRLVVSERNNISQHIKAGRLKSGEKWRWSYLPQLLHRYYQKADAIVPVSEGVASDLEAIAHLPHAMIHAIYNPVETQEIHQLSQLPVQHSWFSPESPPVLLGIGRLTPQKDFSTLISAFSLIQKKISVRLIILGEGDERAKLNEQIKSLGLQAEIDMPGWVHNPYAYMKHARVFVMSSAWEGLPNAMLEALACGCPVVSTDCPSGPSEILDKGRYGRLVPVGDTELLAQAVIDELLYPTDSQQCINRAKKFSVQAAVEAYLDILSPELHQ